MVTALVLVAGCKKEAKVADNQGSSAPLAAPSSGSSTVGEKAGATAEPSPDDNDYAKPILTDDKMQRYIKSLAEGVACRG